MKQTIELTPKSTRWIFLVNGIIYLGLGSRQLADSLTPWSSVLGLTLMVGGVCFALYGLVLLNKKNKVTPKIQVDENGILIKEDIHRGLRKINWEDVREIAYGPFELKFLLNDQSQETLNLATNAEISIAVKKAIRQFANERQITVNGG